MFAPHYARPLIRRCGPLASPVLETPATDATPITTLRPGDEFALLEMAGDWGWGYRRADHHVGYVAIADFEPV